MPIDNNLTIKYGFFHSNSKTLTELSQALYESPYKSSHINKINEILVDNINFAPTPTDAENFASNNPNILKKYDKYSLTLIPGSNYQAWYLHDNELDIWVKPFITPDLITDNQNNTSNGYRLLLFDSNLSPIGPTSGSWFVNPYQGIIHFEKGYTPNDLNLGIPKISCYVYTGRYLDDYLESIKPDSYYFQSDYPSTLHTINHNLNTFQLQTTILVEDPDSGEWRNDLVKISYLDENNIKIYLTDMCNIKVSLAKIK